MEKKVLLFFVFIILFLGRPVQAISSAEITGLGALNLELEYSRLFQTPTSQSFLCKIIHGLSNQVDLKLILGTFGIEGSGGFIYGGGFKWGLLQETHSQPAVSLNLEYFRGAYNVTNLIGTTGNIKIESSFFTPSILISKNLIWLTPYLEVGYDFADIRARNTATDEIIQNLQGSSNTWFIGSGAVFEFDIIQFVLEGIYEFDTPLGESAWKAKAGFNMLL